MIQPDNTPQAGMPTPATSAAAFPPAGQQPILSLVPPIASPTPGEGIRHPDPIAAPPAAPRRQPSSIDTPIAPVRPKMPVTPLIAIAPGAPIQHALSVAPLIPNPQAPVAPHAQTFPFYAAQPFMAPQPFAIPQPYAPAYPPAMPGYGPAPAVPPVQTFIAVVTLYPAPQAPPAAYSQFQPAAYPPQPQMATFQPLPGYMPPTAYPPQPPQQMWPQQPPAAPPGY